MEQYKQNYKLFLEEHALCDFQQSIEWGELKIDWKNEIIIIENQKRQIIATISVLIRKIPLFGNLMYVPRGPVGDIHDKNILEQLTYKINELAKKYHAFVIKIEPNVEFKDERFKQIVKELGYGINSQAMNFEQEIQARHNFRLYIQQRSQQEVFDSFSNKTRYNIRLAQRRDDFRIRKKSYFERLYQVFPKENLNLKIAYFEGEPIAAILLISYGKKMWYLYGASSNLHRNTMPNYLLQWEAIQMAIEQKMDVYDFRGVSYKENGQEDGLFHFKKGFGADLVELIGEIYIPFKPLRYASYQIAERQFRNIRNFFYQMEIKRKTNQK